MSKSPMARNQPHERIWSLSLAAVGTLLVGLCSCASADTGARGGVAGMTSVGAGTSGGAGLVGSQSSGPNTVDNVSFPKKQEGHSGWNIADGGGRSGLQQQIVGWLNASPRTS